MLEIFYAGGTAKRDFSSADIVAEIAALGTHAEFATSREWLVERIAREAREGDLVLVMALATPRSRTSRAGSWRRWGERAAVGGAVHPGRARGRGIGYGGGPLGAHHAPRTGDFSLEMRSRRPQKFVSGAVRPISRGGPACNRLQR